MLAAARGRTDAVRALLRRGADPKISAKVADLMSLAAGDRVAKRERNQVLADMRKKDGADSVPGWRPNSREVQQAVRASLQVEKRDPTLLAQQAKNVAPAESGRPRLQNGGDEVHLANTDLVGFQGGLTALRYSPFVTAMRSCEGVDRRRRTDQSAECGGRTSPLLLATINGHYDQQRLLSIVAIRTSRAIKRDAALWRDHKEWAPTSRTPQPAYQLNQKITYLDLMKALLDARRPNVRLKKSLWYTTYNRDNLRVDFKARRRSGVPYGAIPAMKMLIATARSPTFPR
jgi:hypothetical protein